MPAENNLRVTSHAKIERNTSVGAFSHKRLFRSIFIPCVQRKHSTAVNEINMERPLVPFFLCVNSLWV